MQYRKGHLSCIPMYATLGCTRGGHLQGVVKDHQGEWELLVGVISDHPVPLLIGKDWPTELLLLQEADRSPNLAQRPRQHHSAVRRALFTNEPDDSTDATAVLHHH